MLDILQYIEDTNKAATSDEAFSHLEQTLGSLGLDRVIYSLMTDHNSIGKKRGHGVLKNYPDDWMKYYSNKNYEDLDPVRKYIMQANGAFLWSELDCSTGYKLQKDEKLLMNEAMEAKLLDGIGFSLHAPRNEVLGMGFASSSGGVELHPNLLSVVTMVATQFHTVFIKMNKLENQPKIYLTSREKDVLYWCLRNKSNWAIGEILSISENTVKFHMSRIFTKLSVNGKTQAVLKAINLGLITP
jgi:DNA-binding CsgD family transcriptional regulator